MSAGFVLLLSAWLSAQPGQASSSRAAGSESGALGDEAPLPTESGPLPSGPVERLGTAQGLPHDVVFAIAQDAAGFLWFGTQDGLVRYDGHRFAVYRSDPFDDGSLSADGISDLWTAGDALWIATWGGGLERFDRRTETFDHYPAAPPDPVGERPRDRLLDSRIQTLAGTRDGRIWVGTYAGGLGRLEPGSDRFLSFVHDPEDPSSLPANRVWDLEEGPDGDLWIATDNGLARLRDPGSEMPSAFEIFVHDPEDPTSLPKGRCRSLEIDDRGQLFVGTDAGLARWLGENRGFRTYRAGAAAEDLPSDIVNTILDDGRGGLFVGTSGGLVRMDAKAEVFSRLALEDDSPGATVDIRDSMIDRSGMLWVATRGSGVVKLASRPRIFESVVPGPPDSGALGPGTVTGFAEDGAGRFWVGTVNGLYRRNGESFERVPLGSESSQGADNVPVLGMHVDTGGRFWLYTFRGGLGRYLGEEEGFETFAHDPDDETSVPAPTLSAFHAAPSGDFWLGFDGGFCRFDPKIGQVTTPVFGRSTGAPGMPESGLVDTYVRSIFEDRQGRVWVGTDRGGLHQFDTEGRRIEHYLHERGRSDSLVGNRVRVIFEDTLGDIWVGTGDGLSRFLPEGGPEGRFENFRLREGLPGTTLQSILEGADHRLWIATNNGVSRFDPRTKKFRNFAVADGLHGPNFMKDAALVDSEGRFYFGGYGGYSSVAPSQVPERTQPLPLVLTGFTVFGEARDPGIALDQVREVELGPEENVIGFELAALDFAYPEAHRYRYTMEGFDRDWVYSEERRVATYTNLDPGRYSFRAQVAGRSGDWQEPGLRIAVTIRTPIWQRPWFVAMALCGAFGLLVGTYRARMGRMRRREAELARRVEESVAELRSSEERLLRAQKLESLGVLAGGVAHDFNSLLTGVLGQIDLLRMELSDEERDFGAYLDEAERAAVRAARLSSQMLAYSGRGAFVREDLDLEAVVHRAADESKAELGPNVHIGIEIEPEVRPALVHADAGQLRQMVGNLLVNAVEASADVGAWVEIVLHRQTLDRSALNSMVLGDQARSGNFLVIAVKDLGEGMPAAVREKIFDPFFTTREPGRGLGLPVVLGIVRGHGGAIDIDSKPGTGTEIRIYLPEAS